MSFCTSRRRWCIVKESCHWMEVKWSASRLAVVVWAWVDPRAGVDALMKTKFFTLGRNRTTVSRMTILYYISFVKPEIKGHLRTSRRRIRENNRQMKMVCEDVNWIHLTQDMASTLLLWLLFRNFGFYKSWDSCSAEGLCSLELVNYM